MKEMTIEQKAKAYDKAIAHARLLLKTIGNATLGNLVLKNEFKNMFPALEESEDERIRKTLIKYFRNCVSLEGINGEDISNWLEKQGEQSPAWSEEDKRIIDNLISQLGNLYTRKLIKEETKDKYVNWPKSLRPQSQWKPSESEVRILEQVIYGTANPINYHATLHAILEKLKKLREE